MFQKVIWATDGSKARQVVRTGAGGAAHTIADVARVGTRGHIAPCPVLAVPAADGHASG